MCERSPLGLPHTLNRMSWFPRVVETEILLMNSPKTLRVCGDLKTRPKFVGSDSWGQIFCQLSETEREDQEEGGQSEGVAAAGRTRLTRFPGVCSHIHAHTHLNTCRAGAHAGRAAGPVGGLATPVRVCVCVCVKKKVCVAKMRDQGECTGWVEKAF